MSELLKQELLIAQKELTRQFVEFRIKYKELFVIDFRTTAIEIYTDRLNKEDLKTFAAIIDQCPQLSFSLYTVIRNERHVIKIVFN